MTTAQQTLERTTFRTSRLPRAPDRGISDHDHRRVRDRTVRKFVSEFRGLSGSQKQKAVLDAAGLQRTLLSDLCHRGAMDRGAVARLLKAMVAQSRPVQPEAIGVVGKDHLTRRLEHAGCEMASFQYRRVKGVERGLPCPEFAVSGHIWAGPAVMGH